MSDGLRESLVLVRVDFDRVLCECFGGNVRREVDVCAGTGSKLVAFSAKDRASA